jgi:hypothetical protein
VSNVVEDGVGSRRGPSAVPEPPGAEGRSVGVVGYLNLTASFLLVAPW